MPPSPDSVQYHQFSLTNPFLLCRETLGVALIPLTSQSPTVFSAALRLCCLLKPSAVLPPEAGTILISEGKVQAASDSYPQLPVPYTAARSKASCASH